MVCVDVVAHSSPVAMSKAQPQSPVDSLHASFAQLKLLQSPPRPEEPALLAQMATESFGEDCFFLDEEEEELGDPGLNFASKQRAIPAPVEKMRPITVSTPDVSETETVDVENGWFSEGQLARRLVYASKNRCSTLFREEAGSQPIDIRKGNTTNLRLRRRNQKKLSSVRDSLLAEAWQRKRANMLQEELINVKDKSMPEQLGRSVSDCRKSATDSPDGACKTRSRTRSLTDDDFEELRGCIDLGFRFDENCNPDLCDTLPALEVYYAVTQKLQDSPACMSPVRSPGVQSPGQCSSPLTSWKVASPGDDPKDVKGRLRHWAQAVACNARLCY